MSQAGRLKQHLELENYGARALGVSQVALLDVALTTPSTIVDVQATVAVTCDPAAAGSAGVCRVYAMRVDPGVVVGAITPALLQGMDEQFWWRLGAIPYGTGSPSFQMMRTRSKRTFKTGERLLIVAKFTQQAGGGAAVGVVVDVFQIVVQH